MPPHPDTAAARAEPLDVLWIGEPGAALAALAQRAPQIVVTSCNTTVAADALPGAGRVDLFVIDATVDGLDVLRLLGQLESQQIDRPVVLLTHAEADDVATRANSLAVCDCVVKTSDFWLQLPSAFNQVRARHDLQARLRASQHSHDRLRGILELQPAVTCVLDRVGIVTAMNEAGRAMLATERAAVVGQPITNFIPTNERPSVADMIRCVCDGEPSDIALTLVRGDGLTLDARLRAVPFQRDEHVVALATIQAQVHEHIRSGHQGPPQRLDEPAQHGRQQDAGNELADAVKRQLEDERDQLTRVLHLITGRCEAAEAGVRRLKAAAQESDDRHESDAATIARLRVERDSLEATYEQTRTRLGEIEAALAEARATRARESAAAGVEHHRVAAALQEQEQRANALDRELAIAKSLVEQWAIVRASLVSDHTAVQSLREQIVRVLTDADQQLQLLLTHQKAALARCSELQAPPRA